MRNIFLSFLILYVQLSYAQLNDDFTDGDFSINPTWTGSNTSEDFIVINNRIRSNSVIPSSNFYISTPNSLAIKCRWEFWLNLQLSTSGANYTDIYLISDKADLQTNLINGYFVRVGNTDDEISLYKRSGSSASIVKIIDGLNGTVGSSNNTARIHVSRDSLGLFTLERAIGANSNFFTEGSFSDLAYTNSLAFGILIQQSTESFFQKHFFDDFKIEAIISDTIPPRLKGLTVLDSLRLEVTFNEAMDSLSVKNINNISIKNYPGQVSQVFTTENGGKYIIRLSEALETGSFSLRLFNMADKSGNKIQVGNTAPFTYIKPYSAKFGDVIINEIFPDPSPQIDLPSTEYIELLNTTNETISLKNWKLSDQLSTASIENMSLAPKSILILCARNDTAEFKKFGKVLGLSPWPSLNNSGDIISFKSSANILIDSLKYSDQWYKTPEKKQGGWSLERIDPVSKCEGAFNWAASIDSTGGTPGKQNSVYVKNDDRLVLKADSLSRKSDSTILVYFNKHLNSTSISKEQFRIFPAMGQIKEISLDNEYKRLKILFTEKFSPGQTYQLNIPEIKDCSGNALLASSSEFSFSMPAPVPTKAEKPDTSALLITEILADPSPEVGLPLVEFIEVYNPGTDTVNLDGWSINDLQTKGLIKSTSILPKQYLILCPAADTIQYKKFGKTVGISAWPSLANNEDNVILRSFKNRSVDSIAYTSLWYGDALKKQGGWSLERIDPFSKCEGAFNWTASIDSTGGTPGKKNSVYIKDYDSLALIADSLSRKSDSIIFVYFNKHLNSTSILKEKFKISPAVGQIKEISSDSNYKHLKILFSEKFSPGQTYRLNIPEIKDCSGNTLLASSSEFHFSMPPVTPAKAEKPDTSTLMITEILADPSPEVGLPLVEFIELFNPGTDTVDLKGWSISDLQTKSLLKSAYLAPKQYLILCPAADTALYKGFGLTLGVSPWTLLGNSGDHLSLKSPKNRTIDSLAYSDTWYRDAVKKLGGWSLEKIDLGSKSCGGFYNWAASIDSTGGTPGKENSRGIVNSLYVPVRIDSLNILSENTVNVFFNRIPDTTILKANNFSINQNIGIPQSLKIRSDYLAITIKFDNPFQEGLDYILSANSLLSCEGLLSSDTEKKISLSIPSVPEIDYPVLINEIFADPLPSKGLPEVEFVELFNPTLKKVELKGLIFGNQINNYTFKNGEIDAGEYLILSAVRDTSVFKPFGKVIGLPIWPGLNNDNGFLFLKNNKSRVLQQVRYDLKWYKDTEKQKGGYSLELIDPESVCLSFQNWSSSNDSLGGTPGRKNSVYQPGLNAEPLKLTEIELIDSLTIGVSFNRPVDSLKASTSNNYFLNNGVGNPIQTSFSGLNFDKVLLSFREPLSKGYTYRLIAKNISDCKNNTLSVEFNSLEFILTNKIVKNSILITEILFNPRPGGVDFVEIYNDSNFTLDLKDLSIARIVKDTVNSLHQLSKKQFLFEPGNYLALTPDPENIKKEYFIKNPAALLKISPFPVFNDTEGTAVLISEGDRIDQLTYTEKMHAPLIKDTEGVSLERSKLKRPSIEAGNLRSATAASGFATPGYQNSQFSETISKNEELSFVSRTFSPDNDGFEDLLEISYQFTALGKIANVSIFNDRGLLVKKLLRNFTLNTNGIFVWDGLNDQNQLASGGIYLLQVEIFDTEGQLKKINKAFVLANRFK